MVAMLRTVYYLLMSGLANSVVGDCAGPVVNPAH
jgi:hypothetical protein